MDFAFTDIHFVVSVNASIISDSGGTCECANSTTLVFFSSNTLNSVRLTTARFFISLIHLLSFLFFSDTLQCVGDPVYEECVLIIKRDLITATAGIACIASLLIGLFANLPLGLAPSMGLNAYFTVSYCYFYFYFNH